MNPFEQIFIKKIVIKYLVPSNPWAILQVFWKISIIIAYLYLCVSESVLRQKIFAGGVNTFATFRSHYLKTLHLCSYPAGYIKCSGIGESFPPLSTNTITQSGKSSWNNKASDNNIKYIVFSRNLQYCRKISYRYMLY